MIQLLVLWVPDRTVVKVEKCTGESSAYHGELLSTCLFWAWRFHLEVSTGYRTLAFVPYPAVKLPVDMTQQYLRLPPYGLMSSVPMSFLILALLDALKGPICTKSIKHHIIPRFRLRFGPMRFGECVSLKLPQSDLLQYQYPEYNFLRHRRTSQEL